jgi:predicted RNA-binding protein
MKHPKFGSEDIFGINGVGEEQLLHPHFEKWHKWIIKEYRPPPNKIAVFVACAAIKPYYNSPIHKAFNKILNQFQTHKIVISNAGIIPYEFADCYPFNCYDWNPAYETAGIKERYREVTKQRLRNYLRVHYGSYAAFIAYLDPNSESLKVLKEVSEKRKIDLRVVEIEDMCLPPTSDQDLVLAYPKNLERLKSILEGINRI